MTFSEALSETRSQFKSIGIENYDSESRWAIEHVLQMDIANVLARREHVLTSEQLGTLQRVILRRKSGEPLAYAIGTSEFLGLPFAVGPGVLIPRIDTEKVALRGLDFLIRRPIGHRRILDLGTGSGALLLSLVSKCESARGTGVDLSPIACAFAKKNADALMLSDRVDFLNMDVLKIKSTDFREPFDLIVANPPYLQLGDSRIEDSVSRFEPALALYADDKGLACYEPWTKVSLELLNPSGALLFEVGQGQDEAVKEILRRTQAFDRIETGQDDLKINRWVIGIKTDGGRSQHG